MDRRKEVSTVDNAPVVEREQAEEEAEQLDVVEESLAYDIMLMQMSAY